MPTREAYDRDLAVIAAQHEYEQRLRAENQVFRIRLRVARGQWVGTRDRWELKELVEKYPHLAED